MSESDTLITADDLQSQREKWLFHTLLSSRSPTAGQGYGQRSAFYRVDFYVQPKAEKNIYDISSIVKHADLIA